ncbi:hypothetical protein MXD63_10230, partial [Frankia sp. Cpl3]|nr:hypothetical protein [Frankia sp. Cpl3]
MPESYQRVVALARSQDDMITRCEARRLGMSDAAITVRRRSGGWWAPVRGALVVPPVRDRVRAYARAALAVAGGVVCLLTAARLHGVPGLPRWAPQEPVDVAFADPVAAGRRRAGCRRHAMAVEPPDLTDLGGIAATAVHRTLQDIVLRLDQRLSVPMLRAVLRLGWLGGPSSPPAGLRDGQRRPSPAFLAFKDAVLRRNDEGAGPGGGPGYWRLLDAVTASADAARADGKPADRGPTTAMPALPPAPGRGGGGMRRR